jgi:hypothetical protein
MSEATELMERCLTPVRRVIYGEEVWIAPFCVMGSEVLVEPAQPGEGSNENQN